MSDDRRREIKEFISRELLEEEELVDDAENLLADGLIDSLGMLRLVAYIEETFGIPIPPEDFVISNFRTINELEIYLTSRANG